MGRAGAAVAADGWTWRPVGGPPHNGGRRAPPAADRGAVAGPARAVRELADRLPAGPPLVRRRHLGPDPDRAAGPRRRRRRAGLVVRRRRLDVGEGASGCRAGATRPRGIRKRGVLDADRSGEALGRSRGGLPSKIHLACEGRLRPLAVLVGPGQAHDGPGFGPVMAAIRVPRPRGGRPRTRPDLVVADKAYSSRAIRTHLRRRGIRHTIPEPRDQANSRLRKGRRRGRPVGFDRDDYRRRNEAERTTNAPTSSTAPSPSPPSDSDSDLDPQNAA